MKICADGIDALDAAAGTDGTVAKTGMDGTAAVAAGGNSDKLNDFR